MGFLGKLVGAVEDAAVFTSGKITTWTESASAADKRGEEVRMTHLLRVATLVVAFVVATPFAFFPSIRKAFVLTPLVYILYEVSVVLGNLGELISKGKFDSMKALARENGGFTKNSILKLTEGAPLLRFLNLPKGL